MALIDSGSDTTIIHPRILNYTEISLIKADPDVSITGINGGKLPLMGLLTCKIALCDQILYIRVRVAKYCPYDCVLGKDVLQSLTNVIYDCATGALLRVKRKQLYEECEMFLAHEEIIPARSEMVCFARTNMKEGTEVLFEPTLKQSDQNSLFAACIAKVTDGKIPIHVTNLAQEAVKMYPETRVGRVVEQKEEDE